MGIPHLFGQLCQLGYVVTDIDRVAANMRARYGIASWKIVDLEPGTASRRIAFAWLGDMIFELVENDLSVELMDIHRGWIPVDPGQAWLNHVAYMLMLDSVAAWTGAQDHFRQIGVAMPVCMSFGDVFEFFYADTVAEFGHWSEFLCLGPAGRDFLADIPRY